MLPAGIVQRVDEDEEQIFVNHTKEQIKNAPEYDDSQAKNSDYRDRLGGYYGPGGSGYLD